MCVMCACVLISVEIRFFIYENKSITKVNAIKGMKGAIFHFIFSFEDLLKSIILLQLSGGCQWKCGDELKVMFADVLGSTVDKSLGVKFHLLKYFLGLIFF